MGLVSVSWMLLVAGAPAFSSTDAEAMASSFGRSCCGQLEVEVVDMGVAVVIRFDDYKEAVAGTELENECQM